MLYLGVRRQGAARAGIDPEQLKLVDTALGADEAESHAAVRRMVERNRAAIKRVRVVITTHSRPDVRVSLRLPESVKQLLAASGVAVVDSGKAARSAVLRIHACCWPDGAEYTSGYHYSGAYVGGALLLETGGRLVYASSFSAEFGYPVSISSSYASPSDAPFEWVLGWGLLPTLTPLLDETAIPTLLELRKGPACSLVELAGQALERLDNPRAVETLAAALNESDPALRQAAAEALGRRRDTRAVAPLVAALKDKEPAGRSAAAVALGELKDARAIEPLRRALTDGDERVQRLAAEALCKIGDPKGFNLMLAALKDPNGAVRAGAADALGKLGDRRSVEPLIAALKDDTAYVRGYVAGALGRLKDRQALEPILSAAMTTGSERDKFGNALAQLEGPGVVERLVADLPNSGDVAAIALGQLENRQAVEPLIAALKDGSHATRAAAAEALGRLGDARAVEPLIAALETRPREAEALDAYLAAAMALGKLKDRRAVRPLLAALTEREAPIYPRVPNERTTLRHAAAKALGDLGDPMAIGPLRSLIERECSPAAVISLVRLELRRRLR